MKVTAFFDGGTRASQEIAAGGAVVYDDRGNELAARAVFIKGVSTNNIAEYRGLLLALETALELGATEATIYGDSEVVVRHVDGRYRVRKAHLRPLFEKVLELGRRFETVRIRETPRGKTNRRRDNNARADELCNRAMDERRDLPMTREERGGDNMDAEDQTQQGGSDAGNGDAEKLEETRPDDERGLAQDEPGDGSGEGEALADQSDGEADGEKPAEGDESNPGEGEGDDGSGEDAAADSGDGDSSASGESQGEGAPA